MHILIFIISFQEKVKNYFLFSVVFCIISHVLPQKSKTPQRPECKHGSFCSIFHKLSENHTLENSPRRGGTEQGLLVARGLLVFGLVFILMFRPFSSGLVMCLDFEFRTSIGSSMLLNPNQNVSIHKNACLVCQT